MAKERSSMSFLDRLAGTARKPDNPHPSRIVSEADHPATEVSPIAEKQEGIIERIMKSRGSIDPSIAKDDLAALHGVLQSLSQKTVVVIFAMGKVLMEMKARLPHGEFIPWIEQNCPFGRITGFRYMSVFERYKDEPRRALEELTISEAYIEAGVKKLTAPDHADDELRRRGDIEADIPTFEEYKKLFAQPPLSGAPLKRHRIVPYRDGQLYVVSPELGPLPVCNLYVDMSIDDVAYQDAISQVHQNLSMALEVFYSKVEELEDRGVIGKPFDSSRPAMAKKMRDVFPAVVEQKGTAKKKSQPSTATQGGKR